MPVTVTAEAVRGGLLSRLRLMRLPNALTAVADVIAGGALAGIPAGRLLPLACAAPLLYAGGCVLNDLRDREADLVKHPGRPLPTGAVSPPEAVFLAILLFIAGLLAASLAGPRGSAAGAALLVLILLYDLAAKEHPVAGPLTMGGCRAAAVVLGMSLSLPPHPEIYLFPAATLLYVYALSTLARREGHSPSVRPPAPGIAVPAILSFVLVGAGILQLSRVESMRAAVFFLLFLAVAGSALARGLVPERKEDVPAGVGHMILAIPLLDAVAGGGAGGWLTGFAAAACALPAWAARRHFYIT